MKTVTVSASKSYPIHIGHGLLHQTGQYAAALGKAQKVCIVSDSNVWPLYGNCVKESLTDSGFEVCEFVFPAGEESKNGIVYLQLLNFLAQQGLTRVDLIAALGGGVVGDLAGFAAATYLRGIRFIQLPTTLLAAVDSSVGGKTAIDLPAGKNLAGAFWQPSLVLCELDTLDTLPEDVFQDGCAEVIKYAVLYDPALFSQLEKDGLSFKREDVIACCVTWKREAVMKDEFDTGLRMKLNLGHTVGHGIEAASHFSISHGKAVAMGTAIVSRAFSCRDADRIEALLCKFCLPVSTEYPAEELVQHILSDKKRSADTIQLIVPHTIGNCEIKTIPVSRLNSIVQAGL